MANTIKIKRSNTATAVPALEYGELGWNSADSKLYIGTFSPGTIQVGGWVIGTDVAPVASPTFTGTVTVDNIQLNDNTLSTTDIDGSLIVSPNGTGKILLGPTTADGTTNVVQCQSLTIRGSDSVGGGISPSFTSTGATYFGNASGEVGLLCAIVPAETFDATHPTVYCFTGCNEPVTVYKPILFTAGYFAQFWLDPSGYVGIGTASPSATLDVVGSINVSSTLQLSGSTSGFVAFQSPAEPTSHTYTLPAVTGTAGQVLTTDGSSVLSWTSGVTDGDKGDITVSVSGATWTIDSEAVTYAKIQNVSATDKLLGRSTAGAGVIEEIACTAAGRALLDAADAAAQRTTLGLAIGTNVQAYDAGLLSIAAAVTAADTFLYTTALDVYAVGTITTFGRSLVDDADASTARTTLGLAIGTNVQAYDATLAGLASLNTVADRLIYATGANTFSTTTFTAYVRGLVGAADAATARTTLGLVIGTDVAPVASPTFTGILTTAGQIAFPATVNLSAGANTLDDYEEGTWTPTFTAVTTNPTVTYDAAIRYGIYVKIGKTVFISGTVVITVLTAAGSGNLQISGLPFTASSGTTGGYGSLAIGYKASWTTTTPGTAYVQASSTYIQLGNEAMTATITTANLSAASYIQFSGFYNTTS